MSEIAIRVEGLGKRYLLGENVRYRTLRESWRGIFTQSQGVQQRDAIWALRDVSFDVNQGEVVGVIGRNGAGKSTLLKVLSRITGPTTGKADINGRVGSLLEVGTGFHPELTGRENIFLNGAVLGMRRIEIQTKFDEIVDFAEIEQFLDTPVKHYSSGMYVRLAFAVAAHLEPEILLVDEVLAVGDAVFQKKCLGKMTAVAGEGRTILFVSHNMSSVGALCSRSLLIEGGSLQEDGETDLVISEYLARNERTSKIALGDRSDRDGNGRIRFSAVAVTNSDDRNGNPICGRGSTVSLEYQSSAEKTLNNVRIAVLFRDLQGNRLFACDTHFLNADFESLPPHGRIVCDIPQLPLAAGTYQINVWATVNGLVADFVENAANFTVLEGNFFGTGRYTSANKHGPYVVAHRWRRERQM